uniref:Secreted protein n=1 Tax=Cacopsylla melanoneura TaxID=428564 RepID=A0A8D8RXM0_9HEMI
MVFSVLPLLFHLFRRVSLSSSLSESFFSVVVLVFTSGDSGTAGSAGFSSSGLLVEVSSLGLSSLSFSSVSSTPSSSVLGVDVLGLSLLSLSGSPMSTSDRWMTLLNPSLSET